MTPTQSEEIKNISAEMARLRGLLDATPYDVLARPIYEELKRLQKKRNEIQRRERSALQASAELDTHARDKSTEAQGK
jgi:hypothetical protein